MTTIHHETGTQHLAKQPTRAWQKVMKALRIALGVLAALVGLGWLGFQVRPAPFPAVPSPNAPPETVPLPAGLPAPVERF